MQQAAAASANNAPAVEKPGADDDEDIPELEAPEEEGEVDETGVDAKDIELVVQQVGCSRAKAVRVLKESNGDLINASASYNPSYCRNGLPNIRYSHGGFGVGNDSPFVVFLHLSCFQCIAVSGRYRPTSEPRLIVRFNAQSQAQSLEKRLIDHMTSIFPDARRVDYPPRMRKRLSPINSPEIFAFASYHCCSERLHRKATIL